MARRGSAARKPSSSGRPGGGQGAGILRFYTDDAPGLKMCAPAASSCHRAALSFFLQCIVAACMGVPRLAQRRISAGISPFELSLALVTCDSSCLFFAVVRPRCWSSACCSLLLSCCSTSGASSARGRLAAGQRGTRGSCSRLGISCMSAVACRERWSCGTNGRSPPGRSLDPIENGCYGQPCGSEGSVTFSEAYIHFPDAIRRATHSNTLFGAIVSIRSPCGAPVAVATATPQARLAWRGVASPRRRAGGSAHA